MKLTEITIIETVADYFNLEVSELKSKSHEMRIVKAKHIVCYFLREYTEMSYCKIGELFGLTHPSVIWAIRSVNNQIDTNTKYRNQVEQIKELLSTCELTNISKEVFMENDCYPEVKPEPVKLIFEKSTYKRPFENAVQHTHEFSGYKEHQL